MAIVLKGTAVIKTGGCLCGETRYQISALPLRSSVCHCRYCQLRTGSAFGVSIYFQDDEVTLLSGKLDYFSYSTESGHKVKNERCSICGTNLFWTIDAPSYIGLKGVAGGTFDPPTFWFQLTRSVFSRSKASFCEIIAPEKHETHPDYAPLKQDEERLSGKKTKTLPTLKDEC